MHQIIDFFLELFAGWRVKDQASDWNNAHQKAASSRAEVKQILRSHNADANKG